MKGHQVVKSTHNIRLCRLICPRQLTNIRCTDAFDSDQIVLSALTQNSNYRKNHCCNHLKQADKWLIKKARQASPILTNEVIRNRLKLVITCSVNKNTANNLRRSQAKTECHVTHVFTVSGCYLSITRQKHVANNRPIAFIYEIVTRKIEDKILVPQLLFNAKLPFFDLA